MTSKTTTAGSDTDRQAILDVLAGGYQAWEANDAEAFVAYYTDDASVVQPGVYKKDREEIRTTMAAEIRGPAPRSPRPASRTRFPPMLNSPAGWPQCWQWCT